MIDNKSDRTGEDFGRYRLDALIGQGGMGQVYRAHDTERDRDVALKLLHTELADDGTFQERFRRECQTLARLGEPHIIPIHDFGEIDGTLFLDMRLVDGRDLRSILTERGSLEPTDAVELLEQIAAALTAAHRAGLVHRDVKPENILVTPASFAYLVDFGVARTDDDTRLTKTGTAIGSVAYMPPEQFDDTPVTDASDVYSLTAVLYEMLTGRQPYRGESVSSVMRGVLFEDVPVASAMNSQISPAMDAVISWGMAKSVSDRCRSADELATAARAALQDETVVGMPTVTVPRTDFGETTVRPSVSPQTSQPPTPFAMNRTVVGPMSSAAELTPPGLSGSAPQAYPSMPSYPTSPQTGPSREQGGNALLVALGLIVALLLGAGAWLAMERFAGSDAPVAEAADVQVPTTEAPTPVTETTTATTVVTPTVTATPTYTPGMSSPPSDNRACPGFAGVGTGYPQWTGCEFAANVRDAYVSSGRMGAARTVNGWAPQQQKYYVMECSPYLGVVACRGGNQAVVYIY